MLALAAFIVSAIALFFSGVALAITYRKEAHCVRLELHPVKNGGVVLGINNDGGIDTTVRSIGYFRSSGGVTWLNDTIGDYVANKPVAFPFVVKSRSTFEAYINTSQKIPRFDSAVGLCVQLHTGRIYVLTREIAWKDSVVMHIASRISWLTRGAYAPGIDRPRIARP